ncbi:hypothetical protein JCM15548_11535 [Geofilum rubicundum JCM 15548]|uniref:Uncharacterized protein n=1 Tax=Geofilum rubicundum JCM 15548 TaxID=1236989 RepID=A0A0E9LVK8_9BACT|nr:hypothetical protein JCM15548_11535 [Geofilum rubicundum JCM 15548]
MLNLYICYIIFSISNTTDLNRGFPTWTIKNPTKNPSLAMQKRKNRQKISFTTI